MQSPCSICRHRPYCHAYKLLYRFHFEACPHPREAEQLINALRAGATAESLAILSNIGKIVNSTEGKTEFTAEEIALRAINGKDGGRLNLN